VQRIFFLIRPSRDTLCRSRSKEDVLKNKEDFEDAACNAMRCDAMQCSAVQCMISSDRAWMDLSKVSFVFVRLTETETAKCAGEEES